MFNTKKCAVLALITIVLNFLFYESYSQRLDQNPQRHSFEFIWETLKNEYYDTAYNNLDWDNEYFIYKEAMDASQTNKQTRDTMERLFGELNSSHLNIIPQARQSTSLSIPKVIVDTLSIGNETGLISFNIFAEPVKLMSLINATMKKWNEYEGIIIDLRGNQGGDIQIVLGILGWFLPGDSQIASVNTRNGSMPINVISRTNHFKGNVAVIIDSISASGSELFASAIQESYRGVIAGKKSSGSVLLANIKKLPNGDFFEYPFGMIVTKNGKIIEGHGVIPDLMIDDKTSSISVRERFTNNVISIALK